MPPSSESTLPSSRAALINGAPSRDDVEARLRAYEEATSSAWLRQIVPISAPAFSHAEMQTRIAALVGRLIPLLARGDAEAQAGARQLGTDLADLLYMSGDGLARSHAVLTNLLIQALPGQWQDAHRRAMGVLASLIHGYQDRTRVVILHEQETILAALVTRLERTRADLWDSQARFQSLFLESGIGIWVADMTGETLEANPALLAMLGFTQDELRAIDASSLLHEGDRTRLALLWQQLAGGQVESFQAEARYRHKYGHTIWGHLTVSLVRDTEGQAEYVVAMLQDIDEQRRAAEALRNSDEHLRALIQNSADVIAVVNAWGEFTYLSPAVRSVLGYEPGELLREQMWHLFDEEDLPLVKTFWDDLRENPGQPQYRSIRVRHKSGAWRWIGATCANRLDEPGIQGIVINGRDVTAQIELEDRLSSMAFTDHLTGLASRLAFQNRLREALEAGRGVAVLFADLDRFKVVNDSLGHDAGDQALKALARRFQTCVGPDDVVARLGGDEFAIMLTGADEHDALATAQCMLESMREPVTLQQRQTVLNTSIGIALSGPRLGEPGELLRAADLALYRAKASGRASVALYEPEMHGIAVRRLELEADLQTALERGELAIVYLPEVDLHTGAVVGLEAMVRWHRPGHGLVPQDDFIQIAEETGLIEPIGRWAMNEACGQMRQWRDAGLMIAPLVLSLNISGRELTGDGLIGYLEGCLKTSGLEARQLCLEVSERILLDDVIAAAPILTTLRDLGVQIAIDDFGTGQTSIAALPRLKANRLKIDRELIAPLGENPADLAIIKVIATLAHTLNMRVCAGGVETETQLEYARLAGCARGQGALFSPPLTADEVPAYLARV